MRTRYRIVTDSYAGYEVQRRLWWFPVWTQVGHAGSPINTWPTVRSAELFARSLMNANEVVKEVV